MTFPQERRVDAIGKLRKGYRPFASFALGLSLVAAGGQLPAAAQLQTFQLQWGQLGTGDGNLDAPWGVAVDASTNVFVAEGDNCRVSKFSSTGTFITKFGSKGTGPGQFGCTGPPFFNQKSPTGIAVGPSGNVYVADFTGGRLHKFANNGTFIATWATTFNAFDVESDASENIYVVGETGTIQKFSNTGALITSWSVSGRPKALEFDTSGNAYIAVVDNTFTAYTVDKFTNTGAPLGTVIGPVATPSANISMTVDANNRIYTFDENNGLRKFNSGGGLLGTIAPRGTGDGQVAASLGMASGADLSLYVADFALNRIVKYESGAVAVPPTTITDLVADQPTETTIRLHWSAPSDDGLVVTYDLRRSLSPITPANFLAATPIPAPVPGIPGALETAVSTGHVTGTQYFFAVRAIDDANITSDISNVASTTTLTSPVQEFAFHFGALGTGDGQFNFPFGMAVDTSSHVYVADANNCRIQKFDSRGNFVAKWGTQGTGNGQFSCTGAPTFNNKSPAGIAIGPSGNVYALDFPANRLQKFTSDGAFLAKWNTDFNPSGVAVDASERVFVIHETKQVIRFSSTGVIMGGFSVTPDRPISIALDTFGNLYIAAVDSSLTSYRIRKFANSGGDLGTVIGPVSISNFNIAVALDSKNNIYTADNLNGVRKFNNHGILLGTIAPAGFDDGEIFVSLGMSIDGAQSLYVGDPALQRVSKFAIAKPAAVVDLVASQPTETSALLTWTAPSDSDGVVTAYEIRTASFAITPTNFASASLVPNPPAPAPPGASQSLIVNGLATGRVHFFALRSVDDTTFKSNLSNIASTTTLSSPVQSFALQFGEPGTAPGQFHFPFGVATDASSHVYISDANNCRVQKFTNTGAFVLTWGSQGTGDGQFSCTGSPTFNNQSPSGIAVGPSGNIYTLDLPANRLQKFTPNGLFITKWNTAGIPLDVAVDAAENVFVANQVGTVQKFTSTGVLLASWSVSPFRANSIAIDPSGNVVVMSDDISSYKVERFDSSGGFVNTIVPPTPVTSFNVALAIDKAGDVYTFDTSNGIRKFNSVGDFKGVVASTGNGPGKVSVALGMDADLDRNLYVGDIAQNRVQVFSPAASQSTVTINGQPEVVFISDVPNVTLVVVAPENPPVAFALATATAQGLQLVSNVYEITHTTFNPLASITFRFNPAVVLNTADLALFRFNGVSWSSGPESGITNQVVLDSSDPRVVANVAFTSFFALFTKVDTDSPLLGLAPPAGSTITTPTPLVTASYSDAGGINVASVRLSLDGLDVTAQAFVTGSSATFTSTAPLSQGFHTVSAQVADLAGNHASSTATFRVDSQPPITALLVNGLAASATNIVLVSTDSLGFASADPGTGVFETRYALDGSASEAVFSSTFSLAAGTHSISFYSLDLAGNMESTQTVQLEVLVIDTISPVVFLTPADGSTVTTTAPLIVAQYVDTGRGVDVGSVRLIIDGMDVTGGATVTASSAAFAPSALSQGTHTVTAQLADLAGNPADVTAAFLVDSLAPETALLVNGLALGSTSLVLVSTDSLGFIATDTGTGVTTTRYSVDGSSELIFNSTFSLTPGAHVLTFHSIDGAGNGEAPKIVSLNVLLFDVSAPQITISPVDQSTVTTATPQVIAAYLDLERGIDVATARLFLDGVDVSASAQVTAASAAFTPSSALSQGSHTATAQVADLAGNSANASSVFFIDSLPPLTVLQVNGLAVSTTNPVLISTDSIGLAAIDTGTGVLETRYALDGAAEAVFASTFSLPAGAHTLAFRSVDRAGNAEAAHTSQLMVLLADDAPPTLALTPADGSTVTMATPSIIAVYADSGRGIDPASVRLALDGVDVTAQSSISVSSAVFTPGAALSQGTHTATAEIADLAGNRSTALSSFLIDSLSPMTTLLVNGLASDATSLALTTSDNLSFSVVDSGTGVLETRFTLDGAPEQAFTAPFALAVGAHILSFRSLDKAGNAEVARAVSIQAASPPSDPAPPLVRLDFPASAGVGVEQALGGIVNVRGAVSDASALNWTLEAAPGAAATTGFTTIASGAGNLSGLIAAWNTTALSGYQTVRLRATDAFSNSASAAATVFVGSPVFSFAIGRKDSNIIVNKIKNPTGIAVRSDGLIWVANTNEEKLLLLTSSGTIVAEVDGGNAHGHGGGRENRHGRDDDDDDAEDGAGFKNPQGLALDTANSLYVADQGNDRVVKVSADGSQVLLQLAKVDGRGRAKAGSGPGELRRPWDVAVDGNGDIYVADSGNRRIQVFDSSGTFLRQFGQGVLLSTSQVRGIALTAEGLWVSDKEQDRVFLFSRAGAIIKSIGDADSAVGELSRMRGLASDRLGALYVVEPNRDRTQKFDPQGKGLLAFGSRAGLSHADKHAKRYLTQPIDAAVAPDGSIWVTDTGRDRIVRYALPAAGGFGTASVPAGGEAVSSDSAEPARRLVDHKDGARVERDDGAAVHVPEGALSADLEITVDKGDENQDKEDKDAKRREKKVASASEEVQYGPEGTIFNAPVTLVLPYDANLVASQGIKEDELKVYYWNPSIKDWQAMPSIVDKQNKTVSAQTNHFSGYQVQGPGGGIGVAAIDDFALRDAYAFPNPSRNGAAVNFRIQPGLADSVEVRVYDLAGRKVHSSSNFRFLGAFDDGNGKGTQNTYDHVWDVSGIGSGVYTYIITAKKAGQSDIRKTGKAAVVK